MRKIILSGYMGSGKTTLARLLHAKTNIEMIDLDDYIEQKSGVSIPEIFASKGEIYFRRIERDALIEVLEIPRTLIVSLGGGTPCYASNHELLKQDNIDWIYLKASPETLYQRILLSESERPMLSKNHHDAQEFIAQHLFERSYFYNQAKFKIDTNSKSAGEIVSEIQALLA